MADLNPNLAFSKKQNSVCRNCIQKCIFILLILSNTTLSFSQIPTTGLVAYYPFNGNANDETGNGFNGTNNGAILTTDRYGNISKAYSFNGTSSYIQLPSASINNLPNGSFSCWVKPENLATNPFLMAFKTQTGVKDYFSLYIPTTLKPALNINLDYGVGTNFVGNTSVSENKWTHIVVTWDGTTYKMYLNGVLDAQQTKTLGVPDFNLPILLGKNDLGNSFSKGSLDDIRIYSTAISASHVSALYHENGYAQVADIDGNTYETVQIGTQTWMKENLKVTHYRNGDAIPNVTDNTAWTALTTGAYCNYNNDIATANIYGKLYNFYTVADSRNLCPTGWHVPSNTEWTVLSDYLGGESAAGIKLKEAGITHWTTPNSGADNSSGFTALPGGARDYGAGFFINLGIAGEWSAFPDYSTTNTWYFQVDYNTTSFWKRNYPKGEGFSVRCIKDDTSNGLVAYYPFNGNANDASGNGNNGTVSGATLTTDRFGNTSSAYQFSSSYITVPDAASINPSSEISISFWVNTTQSTSNTPIAKRVYGGALDYEIYLNGTSTGRLGFYYTDASNVDHFFNTTNGTNFNDGKWHNISLTYVSGISSSLEFYLDGINYPGSWTLGNGNGIMADRSSSLLIGMQASSSSGYFDGKLDQIRIYNHALSSSEITALYHEGGYAQMTDYDGNTYETVQIGTQTWMKENLKTTHYRNGDAIQNVTDNTAWAALTNGAYCNYNNDVATANIYGKLYNFYTVADSRNLCPTGWHAPSDPEFKTLEMYLGMTQTQADASGWRGTDQGSKLKSTTGWYNNGNGSNSSEFLALPGGYRSGSDGTFGNAGDFGVWWSATGYDASSAWRRYLEFDYNSIGRHNNNNKSYGFTIRCLKDDTSNGLVAYYPFNGNANDESGNGYNGLVNGATQTNDRITKANSAYSFDGVNNNILINNNSNIWGKSTSIIAWAKFSNFNSTQTIMEAWNSGQYGINMFYFKNTNTLYFQIMINSVISEVTIPASNYQTNTWYLFTQTYDGIKQRIYVNGIEVISKDLSGDFAAPNSNLIIGNDIIYGNRFFNGNLDDIRIYNRALSTSEIYALYHEGGYAQMSDYDGNTYETVQIGTQTWMKENLKVTHYRNGDAIPNVTVSSSWDNLTSAAYSWYHNDENTYKNLYGALYNFYSVIDSRNICPTGWHVSSDTEWSTLETYLGGASIAGGKMKEVGIVHWASPNTGADNSSGFTGLPSGYRGLEAGTGNSTYGMLAHWWTFTSYNSSLAVDRYIGYNSSSTYSDNINKVYGFSVRCLKDDTSNGLVAYYPFNGNTNDATGNGNNGTNNGATLTTDRFGNASGAYSFDGTSNYLQVPSAISLNPINQITISAWVNPKGFYPGSSYGNFIVSKGSDATIGHYNLAYITNTKQFLFTIRFSDEGGVLPSQVLSSTLINLSTWYHIVGTYDGLTMKIYVNGVNENQKSKTLILPNNTEDIYIGKHSNVSYPYLINGKIDDISIYNRALSPSEISTLYHEGGYAQMTDYDGNTYETVQIGTQTWMKENLKVTHYRNGDAIPNVTDNTAWSALTTGAYCEYNNDAAIAAIYGKLYNYFTVADSRNLCPTSWRVPSDNEYKTLEMYLGMTQAQADGTNWRGTSQGDQLKEIGTSHWASPNTGATNSTGFTGLPGSYRSEAGTFASPSIHGFWWQSTENSATDAWYRSLGSNTSGVWRLPYSKKTGFSVRCLKDDITSGLVAYYPFTGNANDASGNGNNGTNNGATLTADRFGNNSSAYSFDGSSNYIQVPTSTSFQSINSEITISSWVKKGSTSLQNQMIVSRRDATDAGIHFISGIYPTIGFMFYTGGTGTPAPGYTYLYTQNNTYNLINDGNWHNISVVHKYGTGTSSILYIDGILYASSWQFVGPNYPVNVVNEPVFIGRQNVAPPSAGFANGYIDDIRIYNRTLSATEIDALYHEGGWGLVPTITSFTPASGPIGTTVTITGTNYSTTPANNIVWFGAVKATVTASTSTTLSVTVPVGATYQLITVTVNGLTAYSSKPFNVTFPSTGVIDATSFAGKVDFTTGTGPYVSVMSDIDGDGKPDLVVSNSNSNTITVYRNISVSGSISSGSFAAGFDYSTGTSPTFIAIGDIDGDGKLDIAVTNSTSNTISVFRNTSTPGSITTGSFASKVDFTVGTNPYCIAMSDLDGDGKIDLAVTNFLSNTISIFRNTSSTGSITTGSFASKVDLITDAKPYGIAISDIDGDGKPDISVVNHMPNYSFSVFRNVSSPGIITTASFSTKVDFATGGVDPFDIAIGDIDGDTKNDVVVTNFSSSTISIFRNTSTSGTIVAGSFGTRVDLATGANPQSVTIGNLDGDGKPDIVVTNFNNNSISLYKNTSTSGTLTTGSFASKVDFTTGTNPFGVNIADIDGDSKPDLIVTNSGSNTVSVFRNTISSPPPTITSFTPTSGPIGTSLTITGTNFSTTPANNIVWFGAIKATVTASTSTSISVTVPVGATYQPITVTVNGLTAYSSKPFNVTFPSIGVIDATSFTAKVDIAAGTNPQGTAIGDIDGDGKPDLIIANVGSNTVSVYRNISTSGSLVTGSFATKVDFTTGNGPTSISLCDFDGDGKLDIAVTNYPSNTISIFRNTSTTGSITTSSFDAKVDFASGTNTQGIAIGDIDGDGKPDFATANQGTNTVSVFRNMSTSGSLTTGSFAAKVDFATGTNPHYIAISDIDDDGKPDIAVTNYTSSSVSILRNTAIPGAITSGSFAAKVDFTTGTNPEGIAIGDIDGDGKLDLAIANANGNSVSVFRNTSSSGSITTSSFASKVDFTAGISPLSISISDIDGDGKADLFVANSNSNTSSVIRNTSTSGSITVSSFATKFDLAAGTSPLFLAIGDLDGDGKPDIAVANNGVATVSIFRNTIASTIIIPTLSTTSATNITITTASSGGNITLDGGSAVTARGVCWSTSTNPTVALTTKTNDGTGSGLFTSSITGLLPATTYYVRAYATNSAGTAYGSEVSFTTAGIPPSITSFTPSTGPIGTAVTITGTGFSTTPANNIVWFGAVKATVTASTSTSLIVTVPVGTTYQPITVTVNGLSGYSNKPFNVTFTSSFIIDATAFASKVDFATGTYPVGVINCDIDGDGKLDLVTTNFLGNAISVYRNTSTSGSINSASFSTKIDFVTGTGPRGIAFGDIDGDGKLDLAVANNSGNSVSIFRNTSTSGAMTAGSFAAKVDLTAGTNPNGVAIGDIDGDGKPDLIVTNYSNDNVAVYRNISTTGTITTSSFASPIIFSTGSIPYSVALGDLDGDTKLDMVVANAGGSTVSLFLNTSSLGFINTSSFASKVDLPTGLNPHDAAISDIDGDGKPDIIVTNYSADGISILRNISTSGSLTTGSFSAKVDFAVRSNPSCTEVVDFDGDGKPDIATANEGSNVISVLKNTSVSGSISLATKVDFTSGTNPFGIAVGDFDGDGKPDIANASYTSNGISVYMNTIAATSHIPTVTSTAISSITTMAAVSGGNVTDYGGSFVTSRGVCWSTTINPTISDAKTTDGTGVSAFTSNLTGLSAGTTYHVRAYATNTAGTGYGSDILFVTVPAAPVTIAANPIAQNSFTANWNITTGATGYYLDVATDNAFNYFITGFNNKDVFNVTTFIVTGLSYYVTYYYRVRAYNASGTSTNSNIISATTICSDIISQTPTGSTSICQGSVPTTYITSSSNALTYVWELTPSGAGTIAGTGTTGTATWNSTYSGTANIRVKGVNGSCNSVWTSSLAITVNPLPAVATISGSQSVCKDQNYAEYSISGTTGITYNWIVDKGTILSGQGSRIVQVTWGSNSGSGKVSLTQTITSTGCTRVDEKSVTITNSVAPAVPVISVKKKINILVCSSKNVNYQWYLDGVLVPSATKQFYWAKDKLGSYQVEVTDKTNLCKNTSKSELISSYTGSSSLMSVYPNPTKDALNIELESEDLGDGRILVYDVYGNTQKTETISKPESLFNYTLNVDGLKPGVYVVEIEVNGVKISNQKFVIL